MSDFPLARAEPVPPGLQREIEHTRHELALITQALRQKLEGYTHLSGWVRRYPYRMLLGAFALGFFLGGRR